MHLYQQYDYLFCKLWTITCKISNHEKWEVYNILCLITVYLNCFFPYHFAKQEVADKEIAALPRDSCPVRIRNRCVLTSRPRGVKRRWRLSRIVFRDLADHNKMSGIQRAMWWWDFCWLLAHLSLGHPAPNLWWSHDDHCVIWPVMNWQIPHTFDNDPYVNSCVTSSRHAMKDDVHRLSIVL